MKTTTRVTVLSALALVAIGGLLFAGPLDPPAGPVTSTYKTLTEVEPRIAINATNTPGDASNTFRITQPGSYYLTGNITGEVGKVGISIETSHVTIDLCGFVLDGGTSPGVAGSRDGISGGFLSNIRVTNGVIKSWGRRGILLSAASNSMYDRLRFSGNGANAPTQALYVGRSAIITDCVFENNIGNALQTDSSCVITRCSISGSVGTGIITGSGSHIIGCSVTGNSLGGIAAGTGNTISGCTASGNTGTGISGDSGSTISGCTASGNTGNGINGGGSTISGCTASNNTGNGINGGGGSTISGCTTRANTLDGILVSGSCLVLSNNSLDNGNGGDGAGIHATGSDNRIEGNTCTNSDRGIDVDSGGNIIIKNTLSGTVWDIVANNIYGPIIDRRIPAPVPSTPAVIGTAAASTLGTTDPSANFTY